MWLLGEGGATCQSLAQLIPNGAFIRITTLDLSNSPRLTDLPSCSSTRRAGMEMSTTRSPSPEITETSWPACTTVVKPPL